MLAYNTTWLKALETSREAKRWMESRLISSEQYETIKGAFTVPLYTPNLFIRIALFIFTCICLSGVTALFMVSAGSAGLVALGVISMMIGAGCIFMLEMLISQKHLYCAGIDDALLYSGLGLIIGGIIAMLFIDGPEPSPNTLLLIALPFLIAAAIRYADRLATLAAYACVIFVIANSMADPEGKMKAFIPFVVMAVSCAVYYGSKSLEKRSGTDPWQKCITVLQAEALVTFYLGGNYLIVRQLTEFLLKLEIPEGGDIPYAWVFYALTVAIPAVFVVLGIRRRDNLLVRTGLLAAAFSIFTFRYYFHIAPPEVALTIGGAVLILAAIIVLRYLKVPKNGITREQVISKKLEYLDAEMLVVFQTLGTTPQSQPAPGFKGGGGEFGGGGATGGW